MSAHRPGAGHWGKFLEFRSVRVVALYAGKLVLRTHGRIPKTAASSVGAGLPVTMDQSVALGTEPFRLIGRKLAAVLCRIGFAIREMVAVHAGVVGAVVERNTHMLGDQDLAARGGLETAMAFAALVREVTAAKQQGPNLTPDRREVRLIFLYLMRWGLLILRGIRGASPDQPEKNAESDSSKRGSMNRT